MRLHHESLPSTLALIPSPTNCHNSAYASPYRCRCRPSPLLGLEIPS